jgi:hypothetical protein
MHPRFTIAHMMLAIAIVALLLAGVTLISMETLGRLISIACSGHANLVDSKRHAFRRRRGVVALSDLGLQALRGGGRDLCGHLRMSVSCFQIDRSCRPYGLMIALQAA